MKQVKDIHFIHANGFYPDAYSPLLNNLNSNFNINKFLIKPVNENKNNYKKIKNWRYFQEKFEKTLIEDKKIIGLGHSIGGNIILRSCINKPEYFSKIILLDPTLFIPRIIFFWKISLFLNLHNHTHPWIKATLRRKMQYNDINDIFNSYIKALIRHFELKEVEETNKYNIEENKEVQAKSPMGTESYFSGGNSYWGNRIRKVSSEDIMNK